MTAGERVLLVCVAIGLVLTDVAVIVLALSR
jgi:hypothetical protein